MHDLLLVCIEGKKCVFRMSWPLGPDGSLCWGELDDSGSSVFGAVFAQGARLPPHPTPITWPMTIQPYFYILLVPIWCPETCPQTLG